MLVSTTDKIILVLGQGLPIAAGILEALGILFLIWFILALFGVFDR